MENIPATVLEELKLVQFRNLEQQTLQFGAGVHFVSGANGQGKTNLLDAIYYLCLSRSHFRYGDASAVQHGTKFLRLAGKFTTNKRVESIVLKLQPRKGKTIERNGVAYASLVEHIGLLPAVMISPADIELVVGGPEERRRFIDQTICQYDASYLQALVKYNRLLKSRNALLKSAAHPLEIDLRLLATYDHQLSEPAQYIHTARNQFVKVLSEVVQKLYGQLSGDAERLKADYVSRLSERPLLELLLASRDQDTLLRRTNVGVHRDELALLLNDENVRKFASQGQLKSIVLALRLTQARILSSHRGKQPVLLLDDLFDRLDPDRVQRLMSLVQHEQYDQVFVTDTDAERLQALEVEGVQVHYHTVEQGRVISQPKSSTAPAG